ncbi:hypothetical protein BGY98DRAFT_914044 [Russula aff. rugulosa BPL654]|nr:hypothetical protein BGY98DRAFT_914044 [Russula aff. rugulosa BPL654]
MPFSTDVNWPQGLLDIFNVSRKQNVQLESRYYGPYDKLLNYAVVDEGSFAFFIAPQTAPDETSPRDHTVHFVAFMVVLNQEQKPVLIAEIKDDRWANEPDMRQRADTQMRQRFDQMLPICAIPRLYGLSLLGTSLRVYCGDKVTGEVTPRFVGRPDVDRILPRDFLKGQWNLNILSPDGLKKVQEIVAYIKVEAAKV